MQTLRLAWRMLLRDFRARELDVLVAAIVLAVASVGTVGFFADRVKSALTREANLLLGGDVMISGDRPLPASFTTQAVSRGFAVSPLVRFNSMVAKTGVDAPPVLSTVKAISDGYPLRGEILLADGANAAGTAANGVPPRGSAWPDTRLAERLALKAGQRITLGDATLTVGAVVLQEPEVASGMLTGGPRILINAADLPSTNLLQPGNRATWRLLVADNGPQSRLDNYIGWVRGALAPGQRLENVRDLQPEVKQTLERADSFLSLASLVAVMLAAVAIALASSRYLRRHLDTAAILKCHGASRARTLALFALQFLLAGVVASAVGVLVALAGQQLLVTVLHSITATPLPLPGVVPGIAAFAIGLLMLFGFALPPLFTLASAAPMRVLRRDLPRPKAWGIVAYVAGAGVFAALLVWQAQDVTTGMLTIGGIAGLLVAAAITAAASIALLKRLPQRGVTWRFGLANLARRPLASSLQIGALALGLMALLLLTVVRGDLLRTWRASLPPDAPNEFIVNVLPDQVEGVRAQMAAVSARDAVLYPMVRGRLTEVDGARFDTAQFGDTRSRRLAEREFNLSSLASLPPSNTIVAGAFWPPGAGKDAGLSLEEGIAKALKLKLGDTLTFDIAGTPLSARITSLRKVDWDSFRPNFFTLFPPHALDGLPTSYLGAVRAPDGAAGAEWVSALVARYPNVLVIDVGDVIRQVQSIMDQVSRAIEFVFLFTLVGGLLVLQAAIASTQDERRFDAAVLRTLGASRAQLNAAQVAEFLLLGDLAGLLAAAGASVVGYLLASRVFSIPFAFNAMLFVYAVAGGAAAVAFAGWLGTRDTLDRPPIEVLRQLA
ncbi:MAG: FtsX-like permease family protein [Casimicrobiaceae bacterium]